MRPVSRSKDVGVGVDRVKLEFSVCFVCETLCSFLGGFVG